MMKQNDIRVTHEAARWFMELQTEGEACYPQFARWLRRSPDHIEEFMAISGLSRKLDGVDSGRHIDVNALLADDGAEILRLLPKTGAAGRLLPRRSKNTRWVAGLATAAGIVAVAVLTAWLWAGSSTYSTHIGEQRTLKLSDGSVIQLNTQSKVHVGFSDTQRDIQLLEGEVLFTVERDAKRPFRVLTDTVTVQALGTQFNVYRLPAGTTTISVVEGAVQVSKKTHENEIPIRLTAGEQAGVDRGHIEKQPAADIPGATAWRERRLMFRDKPLAEIVAEFNRYNTLKFEVDEKAGREPLSGVFAADRPESFALFLARDESIRVERRGERFLIRER